MQNPWEDSVQSSGPHCKMFHTQPHFHFPIQTEHGKKPLQGKQQAPRKNKSVKHISPMMLVSCLSTRCKLAYGKHGWPLFYSYGRN